MIAAALACEAQAVDRRRADHRLDVTVQKPRSSISSAQHPPGARPLHHPGLARSRRGGGDVHWVVVTKDGRVIEIRSPVDENPAIPESHDYTRRLIASQPALREANGGAAVAGQRDTCISRSKRCGAVQALSGLDRLGVAQAAAWESGKGRRCRLRLSLRSAAARSASLANGTRQGTPIARAVVSVWSNREPARSSTMGSRSIRAAIRN